MQKSKGADAIHRDAAGQSEANHAGGHNNGASTAVPRVIKPTGEPKTADSAETFRRDPDVSRPKR